MGEAKLLPCPHCGGPARRWPYQHDRTRHSYGCESMSCVNATWEEDDDETARAVWNQRVDPLKAELVEALENLTHYCRCVMQAWKDGRGHLDMSLIPHHCDAADAALARAREGEKHG